MKEKDIKALIKLKKKNDIKLQKKTKKKSKK